MGFGGGLVLGGGDPFDGIEAFPNQGTTWYPLSLPTCQPVLLLPGMDETRPADLKEGDLFTLDSLRVWRVREGVAPFVDRAPHSLSGTVVALAVQPRGWMEEYLRDLPEDVDADADLDGDGTSGA